MGRYVLNLPYLKRTRSKGRDYFYYRRDKRMTPLPHIDAVDFKAVYDKTHLDFSLTREATARGTFAWLVEQFKTSSNFTTKAPKTQKDYKRILDSLVSLWGDLPARSITRAAVLRRRDLMAATPRTANYFTTVVSLLFAWAIDRGYAEKNPASRPKRLKTKGGHKPWSDIAITRFIEANASADPEMVLALTLGLYTGLREGDVIKLNRTHYNGAEFSVTAHKNDESVWVTALTPLKLALDAIKARFMLLQTKTGRPFKEDYFRHRFRAAVLRADLDGLTFHGLRTTAATVLAEWCTDAQLQAIFGWRSPVQAAHYRRMANKKKLASIGMSGWEKKLTVVESNGE